MTFAKMRTYQSANRCASAKAILHQSQMTYTMSVEVITLKKKLDAVIEQQVLLVNERSVFTSYFSYKTDAHTFKLIWHKVGLSSLGKKMYRF